VTAVADPAPARAAPSDIALRSTQLLLIRHGASAAVVPGEPMPRRGLQADPPLSPVGQEEALRVAARLRGEDVASIYHSPLQRTMQTAAPLAAALGMTPIVEEDLREVFLGDVDGLDLRSLVAEGNDDVRRALREQRWEHIPGAETHEEFAGRTRSVIQRLAEQHVGSSIAVFTHGGFIGQVLAEAAGASALHAFINADNASITQVSVTRRRWTVRGFNDIGHLQDKP
jgi:probable phosphoglycerate mutase